jgi:hypothetical protein
MMIAGAVRRIDDNRQMRPAPGAGMAEGQECCG